MSRYTVVAIPDTRLAVLPVEVAYFTDNVRCMTV